MTIIHESNYTDENYILCGSTDGVLSLILTYPGTARRPDIGKGYDTIFVNQESVRASDGIRLKYDFDRDGWSIMQERRIPSAPDDSTMIDTGDWVEVAFVQSWSLEEGGR